MSSLTPLNPIITQCLQCVLHVAKDISEAIHRDTSPEGASGVEDIKKRWDEKKKKHYDFSQNPFGCETETWQLCS